MIGPLNSERLHYVIFGEWKKVSPDEAKKDPSYGLWGWLLLFYLMFLFAFLEGLARIFGFVSDDLTETEFLVSQPIEETLFIYGLQLPFLILAPIKHRLMPKLTIAATWLSLLSLLTGLGRNEYGEVVVIFALITPVLFTWYLLRSKRVNVTYRHRRPINAPALGTNPNVTGKTGSPTWTRLYWVFAGIIAIGLVLAVIADLG